MNDNLDTGRPLEKSSPAASEILQQYGVGSTRFAGSPDALYERHLKFDNIVEAQSSDARERYEAAARAVRDVLSSRWLQTDETYTHDNPKRIYYVSIEFLIGRSLASNVMNLMLDPVVGQIFDEHGRQWIEILDEEPDAGLGNGGLGRLTDAPPQSNRCCASPSPYLRTRRRTKTSKVTRGAAAKGVRFPRSGECVRGSRSLRYPPKTCC
jgi:hypothetical protein